MGGSAQDEQFHEWLTQVDLGGSYATASAPCGGNLSDYLYDARLRLVRGAPRVRRVGVGGMTCLPTSISHLVLNLCGELHTSLASEEGPFRLSDMAKFGVCVRIAAYCGSYEKQILLLSGHAVGVSSRRVLSLIYDSERESAFAIRTDLICQFAYASSMVVLDLLCAPAISAQIPLGILPPVGGRPNYPLNRVCIYDGRPLYVNRGGEIIVTKMWNWAKWVLYHNGRKICSRCGCTYRGSYVSRGGSKYNIVDPRFSEDTELDLSSKSPRTVCVLATAYIGFSIQYLRTLRHVIFRSNASFLATAACVAVEFPGDRISEKRMAGYIADAFFTLLRLREVHADGGSRYFPLER